MNLSFRQSAKRRRSPLPIYIGALLIVVVVFDLWSGVMRRRLS